jgi:hypothetical protein
MQKMCGYYMAKRGGRCCKAERIQKAETSDRITTSPAPHPRTRVLLRIVCVGRREEDGGAGGDGLA